MEFGVGVRVGIEVRTGVGVGARVVLELEFGVG